MPAVLAWRVLLNSPALCAYYVNRVLFHDVTIWCTVVSFVFAWWGLQRGKALQRHVQPSEAAALAE